MEPPEFHCIVIPRSLAAVNAYEETMSEVVYMYKLRVAS
jgi:hypothetical protein